MLEALTGDVPWGSEFVAMVSAKVLRGERPQLPVGTTKVQCKFLSEIWLADQSKKPTLLSVVHHLKQFAVEQESKQSPKEGSTVSSSSHHLTSSDSFSPSWSRRSPSSSLTWNQSAGTVMSTKKLCFTSSSAYVTSTALSSLSIEIQVIKLSKATARC